MDERWVLIDERTGLHVGWYFWLRVLDEANRAARYGTPFGLLLLEAVAPRGRERLADDAAARVPRVIRSTDLGGIVGPGRVGVMLPHQDAEAAEQAAGRIVEELVACGGNGVSWSRQMLCYPRDAAEISILLTTGWQPHEARRRRDDVSA
ncbi:MAG TPA: hypothetical protein VFC53_03520 [Dehalococcoidia bacterium]|nr:hypothetical protein [Dehalococcoidia bacterium]